MCPAFGGFETTGAVFDGSGESTARVAEKFAFKQIFRNRSAIDADERFVFAPAALVDFARDQFLAGAAFAQNQHRRFGGRDEINLADDVPQGLALAHQFAEGFGLHHFFFQVSVLHFELRLETLNFLERPRVGDGRAEVIGENLLPGMSVFREVGAGKNGKHSQHFASKRDGRSHASSNFFRLQEFQPGKFSREPRPLSATRSFVRSWQPCR